MSKITSLFILCRPANCLISLLSVWAGGVIAGDIYFSFRLLVAALTAVCVTAFGNIVNDYFDLETDRINKPFRPLPSGMVKPGEALLTAIILGAIGLILALSINLSAVLLAFAVMVILLFYSPALKGLFFLGNIAIAAAASMAFILGGIAVGEPFGSMLLVVFSFLYHLGREIVKDIQDVRADTQTDKRTGATIDNSGTARIMAVGVFMILIISTIMPFATGSYGAGYLIIVVLGVDIVLILSISRLLRTDEPEVMRKIALWTKIAMPLGIFAIYIGSRGW